ncbi:MAG: acyl-CoA dehydrogenase C-terminal domain-containing protein [Aliidongia sp.]
MVRAPKGFKEAFQKFCDAGWNRLSAPEELGGANLPSVVTLAFGEMGSSANQAFAMYPGLSGAAYSAIWGTGEDWMKEHVVPRMVSGEWTGTMCLTEPHCGTDLKLMKTRAVPQPDGTYRMTGTKIFISGGDHDMTDNIIHTVIAKIPDEDGKLHDDLGTVNFFMVPKYLVDPETGAVKGRNGVSTGGVEKKMGIKGQRHLRAEFRRRRGLSPGRPVGERRQRRQGIEIGRDGRHVRHDERRPHGRRHAGHRCRRSRLSERPGLCPGTPGRPRADRREEPDGPADPIIVYPDVRRLLISSRAFVEGARALAAWVSLLFSVGRHSPDVQEREEANDLAQLLTPVIKAYFTDKGFEAANASMQVFGGHGYIREHGMEQFVRDARINQVYEGANGIQALDLVARKMTAKGGRGTMAFFGRINAFIKANEGDAAMAPFVQPLKLGHRRLGEAAGWLMQNAPKNYDHAGAASYDVLTLFGIVSLAWMWAQMAKIAQVKLAANEGNPEFYKRKLTLGEILDGA